MSKPFTPDRAVSFALPASTSARVGASLSGGARISRPHWEVHVLSSRDRSERARIAGLSRHHGGAPDVQDRRREFKTARLEEYIRKTVDSAPELTQEQRDRLALLLRAPSGGAAA